MIKVDKENLASLRYAPDPSLTRTNIKAVKATQVPSKRASKRKMHEAKQAANKKRIADEGHYQRSKTTAELARDLPQELFDSILALVMTPDIPTTSIIHIDKGHKPPKSLQLTRSLHDDQAQNYYATNVFSFTSLDLCCRWVKALAPRHSRWVKTVRYVPSFTNHYDGGGNVIVSRKQKLEEARKTFAGVHWKMTSGLMFQVLTAAGPGPYGCGVA